MCLACQHFDFNSVDWISYICVSSPADICEQWERNLSSGSADVSGAGTRDEPLRTSLWEANVKLVDNVNILKSKLRSIQLYFFILLYFFCNFYNFCIRVYIDYS